MIETIVVPFDDTRTERVVGCSACGADHDIEFTRWATDEAVSHPWRGMCKRAGRVVYMRYLAPADLEADDRPERSLAPRAGPMPVAPVPYGLKDMNARCR